MNTSKTESAPKIDFPTALMGEWTPFPVKSPLGLFAYRISQAIQLLEWPDFYGLEAVSQEERRRIKDGFLQVRHPITALGLFLGVVAMEDFMRDLLHQLREDDFVCSNFPEFQNLTAKFIDHNFRNLAAAEWNNNLSGIIGLTPIPERELPHIADLVLLRNVVAHYGSLTPEKFRNNFKYWNVKIGHPINPPASFVRTELNYIFHLGNKIHEETRHAVFRKTIEKTGCGWSRNPSPDILRLIELFCFFGYVEEAKGPTGLPPMDPNLQDQLKQDFPDLLEQAEAGRQDILRRLQGRCLDKLVAEFGD
jgi:hypothetical protein